MEFKISIFGSCSRIKEFKLTKQEQRWDQNEENVQITNLHVNINHFSAWSERGPKV